MAQTKTGNSLSQAHWLAPVDFARAAALSDIPFVVSPVEATAIGGWTTSWRDRLPALVSAA